MASVGILRPEGVQGGYSQRGQTAEDGLEGGGSDSRGQEGILGGHDFRLASSSGRGPRGQRPPQPWAAIALEVQ